MTVVTQFISSYALLPIGILLLAGYFLGKLAQKLRLPSITGYIIAGLILGESIAGVIPKSLTSDYNSLTDMALGIIALTIGGEFSLKKIKLLGSKIIIITIFEAVFAFVFVTTILTVLGFGFYYALLLGAIATATAPAATVIVIRELKAKGEFIDYLYGVVAFDDAVCVIIFSLVFALVVPLLNSAGVSAGAVTAVDTAGVLRSLLHSLGEIGLSIAIGFLGGFLLNRATRKIIMKVNEVLLVSLAFVLIVIAVSIVFKISLLIANMMMGATLINLSSKNLRIFNTLEPLTPPLFALFFILAGTELDLAIIGQVSIVVMGLVYIASRFSGKMAGVVLSATLVKASSQIRKYLGFCLFPQAGVAIGLSIFLQTSPALLNAAPEMKEKLIVIVNIILFSVFINELIGPIISRYGVRKGCGLH